MSEFLQQEIQPLAPTIDASQAPEGAFISSRPGAYPDEVHVEWADGQGGTYFTTEVAE